MTVNYIHRLHLTSNYLSSSLSIRADSTDFPNSLSIRSHHPSLPAGIPIDVLCSPRADVKRFLLVGQHERHLWVLSCFSSSVSRVLFVLLGCFLRWEVSDQTAVVSSGVDWRIFFSKSLVIFLCSSNPTFSLCVLLAFIWCIHTVVWTQPPHL